ncbi:E3 SUMO-protein ligase ZBED1-like [Daphnia pulicaria]|uniref:E3 SUMO-protein ligase ZBED1-like n=1 Tax=Daphnia pulicaria TaxID=35523 RepID=UPI001EEBE470|nr:E3 SUMO-protein ligase ZBED1-like [Daphnia pulicaria]
MYRILLVDNPFFIACVRYLDPRITLPCRSTITHKHLPEKYNEAVNKLKEELVLIRWVALTTDGWTCSYNRHYTTVTVHYINSEMKMISRVLTNEHMEESCTSENFANKLKEIADNWYIFNKVFAVVTDNSFNVVGAIKKLLTSSPNCAGWRHVHCFAHTLSLIVKERTPEFLAILLHRTIKVLAQDVATRSNSTFIMIRSLIDLKDFVQDTLRSSVIDRRDLDLNEFEWEILANAVEMLKPFDELTKDLSSQITRVFPKSFLQLFWLKERFEDSQKTCTHSTPHLIATYLNPRFKKLDLYFSSGVSSEAEKRTENHIVFS